jgi:two-component system cell cycle response regulator DivK
MITGGMQKPRLLVLENAKYQRLFDAILGSDYEILPTDSASEAVRLAHAASPDLILMSNALDSSEDLSTVRQMRQSLPPAVPILLVLSTDQPTLRRRAEQAGCNGFLIKPIDPDRLKSQIENWLNRPTKSQVESV